MVSISKLNPAFCMQTVHQLSELNASMYEMEHIRSGIKLIWLDRQTENKTFSVTFRTYPWDDTGVFHILEHSVLCGSTRYPVKEPFVELMKSSLNTFLNAITFSDKTVYPISSRNDHDFINLMRVYMDAVLHPSIYQKPEIFQQEGWHYELSEKGIPTYQGVVFNEMKGAFASPDTHLRNEILRRLFPDTCYRFVSGGDPEHIPELTYTQFIAAHRRFYHPSNACIFLDGQIDIQQVLSILDTEYLSAYERSSPIPPIPMQKPVFSSRTEIPYALSLQEPLEGKCRLANGYVAGTFRDREDLIALQAICSVLCGDNPSSLKWRLLEKGMARNARLALYDNVQQPWILLEIQDIVKDRADTIASFVQAELTQIAQEGLDHDCLTATLANLEFQLREQDYGSTPQGLGLNLNMLSSWLYGGSPAANLEIGNIFKNLFDKQNSGYFESLLQRTFLHNGHSCQVLMYPSHTFAQETEARENARLRILSNSWTKEQIISVQDQQNHLKNWQHTPDSPEALAAIPKLEISQISNEPPQLPLETETFSHIPILRHNLPTNGIVYLNLYFALDDLSAEDLSLLSFVTNLLGSLETRRHGIHQLQNLIHSICGSVKFNVETYGTLNQPNSCRTFLTATYSTLESNVARSTELIVELLQDTVYQDKKRILQILGQCKTILQNQVIMSGQNFAMKRVLSRCTAAGAVSEHAEGITFLQWLKKLEQDFACRFPALCDQMSHLLDNICRTCRLTVSVTGPAGSAGAEAAAVLASHLPKGMFAAPLHPVILSSGCCREGIVIPTSVSFSAMGEICPGIGRNGKMRVLGRIISLAYLWNAVRVQGGAYGTGMVQSETDFIGYYSYRDPNVARTLDCYQNVVGFLNTYTESTNDLTRFIIGAIAESDPLLTCKAMGRTADAFYWKGISYETRCSIRHELLSTTREDISHLTEALAKVEKRNSICVIGSQQQLKGCGSELDTVWSL